MASPRDFQGYSDLERAIRRLPIRPEKEYRVRAIVDYLALMGGMIESRGGDGTVPPHFRPANKEMVSKQLNELERRANDLAEKIEKGGGTKRAREQLARHIRQLHEATITALADAPAIMIGNQPVLADIASFRSGMPERLERDEVSSNELLFWAKIAELAKTVPWKLQNVGRLPDKRAHAIADLLAGDYHDLTGSEPTFSVAAGGEDDGRVYGPFLDFVREIFQVLNIRRDALGYASKAAFKLRGRGRKK